MTGSPVAVYFDPDGNLCAIVHSDDPNYDLSVHDAAFPEHARATVARHHYDAIPHPINVDGKAHHGDLEKHIVTLPEWETIKHTHPRVANAVHGRIR